MRVHGLIRAPEFPDNLEWMNISHPLTINGLKGKIILLDFWTYCCINCHHNISQLRKLHRKYPDNLVIIGVHSGKFSNEKKSDNIRQAMIKHGIEYPVVNDADFNMWQQYSVKAWPTIVLIDPNGRIVSEISGEILAEPFMQTIEELIYEYQDSIDKTPLVLRHESSLQALHLLQHPSKLLYSEGQRKLFISDTGNHRIIEIDLLENSTSGCVNRVFGNGHAGFNDGFGDAIAFNHPHGLALYQKGNTNKLYVADTENHAIRAINLNDGSVSTIAGTGEKAHGFFEKAIPADMPLRSPWALVSLDKYLFIAMAGSHQIWVLIDENELAPFAGNGREALVDGSLASSSFNQPSDLTNINDSLFIADSEASAIRKITLSEPILTTTLVGKGLFDFGDRDGIDKNASLQHPVGICHYKDMLFIADTYNHKIKTLDLRSNEVKTLIGNGNPGNINGLFEEAQLNEPEGLQASNRYLFIADTNNHEIKVANLVENIIRPFVINDINNKLLIKAESRIETKKLNPVEIRQGQSNISLSLKFPKGFIRNKSAPSRIEKITKGSNTYLLINDLDNVEIPVNTDIENEITLDMQLYYCEKTDYEICLIHKKTVTIPFTVNQDALSTVFISYQVDR